MQTMKAKLILAAVVLSVCPFAHGQFFAVSGNCELPGQAVVVSGFAQSGTQPLSGSPTTTGSGVMASYPQCIVTVYPAGSGTPVATGSVFSNATGTVLGNPFTANTDGSWAFYVAQACYDVTLAAGTTPASQLPAIKTLSGKCAGQGSGGGGGTVGPGTQFAFAGFNTTTTVANAPCNYSGLNVSCLGNFGTPGTGSFGSTPPVGCGGSAGSCIAFGISSGAGVPSANQSYMNSRSTGFTCSINGGAEVPCFVSLSPTSSAQPGDTLRFSIYGDNAWDATNFAGKIGTTYCEANTGGSSNQLENYGTLIGSPTTVGTLSTTSPSASDDSACVLTSSSSASTSTVIGLTAGNATNTGSFGIGSFYRMTNKFAAGNTTSVRYWMGFALYNTGSSGCANVSVVNTTCLATDTPTRGLIGFRYSATTDTNWQAVACLTAGTCTLVNTGKAIDTSEHFFEMATTGTVVTYFIDGAVVATISTNVPAANLGTGANGSTGGMFWVGDNKNTATSISGTMYYMSIARK